MDLVELKEKKIIELTKLARKYKVEGISGMRKQELIFAILKAKATQAKDEKNPEISISYYEKVASLYSGELFEEDPYCEWCFDAREGLKEKYLDTLNEIIAYYGKKGDFHKGIEYATTYLNTDKYDETIYKELMQFYSHTGNRAMVLKTFENCKKALEEGLDCPPDEETETLYRQLTSQ